VEVTVVFLDLRGFTAFAEASDPEEVMGVLREFHAEMGRLILEHEGTLERFTGDGMMIFFNDPVPVPDAPERAIRMALAIRERVEQLDAAGASAAMIWEWASASPRDMPPSAPSASRGAGTTAPSAP
jgi:class 3 adenylate cyclase